jgi:hypothetical protein
VRIVHGVCWVERRQRQRVCFTGAFAQLLLQLQYLLLPLVCHVYACAALRIAVPAGHAGAVFTIILLGHAARSVW